MIETIRRTVVAVAKSHASILGVLLFGSYARGEQCENSDIDLIVMCVDPLRLDVSSPLREQFRAHNLADKPDLTVVDELGRTTSASRWMRFSGPRARIQGSLRPRLQGRTTPAPAHNGAALLQ